MIAAIFVAIALQTSPAAQPAAAGQDASPAMQAFAEGNAAYEKRENDKALAAYDRAIALDPKNADFHIGRCRTLARMQQHEDAIASCSQALTLRPDDAAALIDRGHFYINARKLQLALADLTRVESMKKEDYGLYYHLALARYITGDYAKAAESYEGCVRTAPNPDNRTACMAWQHLALARAGRKADAQRLLDSFTPDPKAAPSAYIDRLLLFKGAKGEEDVAKTMEKDAVQLPTVGYSIGIWHLLNGREAKAREYFEKAVTAPSQLSAFGSVASYFELQRMKTGSKPSSDEAAVQQKVEDFLRRLGNHEVATLAADFVPKAIMVVTRERQGAFVNSVQTLDEFLAALGKNANPKPFSEPLSNVTVTIESGHLAHVRADFTVVREGKVLSTGVDHFTLVREPDGWKIVAIAYTSLPARAS